MVRIMELVPSSTFIHPKLQGDVSGPRGSEKPVSEL